MKNSEVGDVRKFMIIACVVVALAVLGGSGAIIERINANEHIPTVTRQQRAAQEAVAKEFRQSLPEERNISYQMDDSSRLMVVVNDESVDFTTADFNKLVESVATIGQKHVSPPLDWVALIRGRVEGVSTDVYELSGSEWPAVSHLNTSISPWATSHTYDAVQHHSQVDTKPGPGTPEGCSDRIREFHRSLLPAAEASISHGHTIMASMGDCAGKTFNVNLLFYTEDLGAPETAQIVQDVAGAVSKDLFPGKSGTITMYPDGSLQFFCANPGHEAAENHYNFAKTWPHGRVFDYKAGRYPRLNANGNPMLEGDANATLYSERKADHPVRDIRQP